MRISDWSSDVCPSDLIVADERERHRVGGIGEARRQKGEVGGDRVERAVDRAAGGDDRIVGHRLIVACFGQNLDGAAFDGDVARDREPIAGARGINLHLVEGARSEEHTSELQSLMRISYAVFCLKKKKKTSLTTP